MGFLDICKGKLLLKYGSTKSTECECPKDEKDNIFTDASLHKDTGQGGYGVYSPGLKINMAKPCSYGEHKNNVMTLESKAILEAVKNVKKNHKSRERVDIFSDSEHALTQLQVLQNGEKPLPGEDKKGFGESILKEIGKDDWSTKVHMHKVKAHSGVQGNEIADRYAKMGAKKAPKVDPSLLPKSVSDDDHQIYSYSPSFRSCNQKRSRVSSASPYPANRSSVSPSPYKMHKRSPVSPYPANRSSVSPYSAAPPRNDHPKPAPPPSKLFGGFLNFKS